MQALKSYAEVHDRIEHLVQRVVYVTPNHCIFETSSQALADECVELLSDYYAYTVSKNGNWFVSVPL